MADSASGVGVLALYYLDGLLRAAGDGTNSNVYASDYADTYASVYTYNPAGNLTGDTSTGDLPGTITYGWDHDGNRLSGSSGGQTTTLRIIRSRPRRIPIRFDESGISEEVADDEMRNKVITAESAQGTVTLVFDDTGLLKSFDIS